MQRIKAFFQKRHEKRAKTAERDAKFATLEELFNDLYDNRKRIYKLNFIRGILFGAGSAIGGTLILALIVWVLALFVNVPLIGELFKDAQQSIEQRTDKAPGETPN